MKKLFYFLICLLGLFSCSEGAPENEGSSSGGSGSGGSSQPQVMLDVTSSDFTVDGGSKLITFTASEAWTASVVNGRASGWCKVEPTSGAAGNASVTITTTANDTSDDRTASVVIKAGNVSKTISVSQKQKDALTLTTSKFELSSQGGEVLIEVKANVDYECEIEESSQSWITYTGSRALKSSTVVLKVSENAQLEGRSGKVYIKGNGLSETIEIYQAGETPAIVISQKEYTVSSAGATITVDVSSNVDVEVELPSGVDWISENATRSTSTHTYRFDVAPSEEYNQRTAEIKFINKENNLAEAVTVTQVQKDALVLAKDNYTVSNGGGQIEVEVGHNIDFDVSIGVDWISQVTSRSLNTSNLVFNVSANTAYDSRSGVITFASKDGTISQTVTVYQAAEGALIISQKDVVVGQESGSLSFEIQSNLEFTVSEPDADWLRPVTSRGLTTHTLRYEYDANTSYESRVAKIIVTNTQNNQCDTLTVTQAQKDALVLAKESYTVENSGGQLSVEIGHNVDFDVSIDVDWIIQPVSRSFVTSALVFNVEPNTNYESRSGVINFTSKDGSITQKVTVLQSGEQALIVSQKEIALGSSSGTFSFEVQTNVEFSVSSPDVDWLRPVTDASSRGLTTHTLRYEYDANTTYDSRQAQIVVTDTQNNRSETITVTQAQNNAIVLGKNVYQVDGKGGQLQIEVSHNVEFDIQINDSWISQSASRSLSSSTLILNVEANPDDYTRWGYVYLTAKDGSCSQTIVIEQAEGDKLIISNKEIFVSSWSGSTWIEIQANVPFSVGNPDVSWLRVPSNSRSMSYHSMLVEFDENTSYESRVGKIVVTDLKNNKSDTITVTQAQKDAIVLAVTNYKLSSKSGQLQIKVDHNVEFDVSIDVDWITQSISRSLGSLTLIFNVAENPYQKDREGTITFTSKNGAVTQTVKVLQKSSLFDPSIKDWEDDGEHGGTAE